MKSPSPRSKKRLDLERMVREIDAIVNSDWGSDINFHDLQPKEKWSQKVAQEMADALMNIYSISHCITCEACQVKYRL